MSDYITIPLSKTGKYAGLYEAIVSDEDKDLAELNWTVFNSKDTYTRYAYRKESGKTRLLHRIIAERILRRPIFDREEIDHINRNGLDNRRENLRLATHSQNGANKGLQRNNTSGYRGVFWNTQKKKWHARIKINQKQVHIGFFDDKELAYEAYLKKAEELFGEFLPL